MNLTTIREQLSLISKKSTVITFYPASKYLWVVGEKHYIQQSFGSCLRCWGSFALVLSLVMTSWKH